MLLFILWFQTSSGPTRAELEEKLSLARDTERIEILNQLAELLVASDPTKSLQYTEDARTQATELRDPLQKERALKNVGMASQVMGRYEEAQRSREPSSRTDRTINRSASEATKHHKIDLGWPTGD